MQKKRLNNVTLLGIDCVDVDRLALAMNICQQEFEFAEVKILSSLASNNPHVINIEPIKSLEEYSLFVLSELYKYVDTEFVLLVQHDGFILNSSAWDDEFLEYDYIGAPWLVDDFAIKDFDFPEQLRGQFIVGNGGFSLRSKKLLSTCTRLVNEEIIQRYHPEDVAICVYNRTVLEKNGIKFAPTDLAKKFSFEAFNEKDKVWNDQFGFHGLNWTDISNWAKKHPEYHIINPAAKNTDGESKS